MENKILKGIGYSYNDLTIVPAAVSAVNSRKNVDPFCSNGMLPIFTAPMSTVVDAKNISKWESSKITPIAPRNLPIEVRLAFLKNGKWAAFSLEEAKSAFIDSTWKQHAKICIDVANGHMEKLMMLCEEISCKYGNSSVSIMAGNIANPETLLNYEDCGISYARLSIGSGAGCLTAPQTGIHYPIASLINECYKMKREHRLSVKLIADGGIRNYGDVIKAIALGADYAMVGSVFAGLYESAAEFLPSHEMLEDEESARKFLASSKVSKVFYGMSTKEAQKLIKPECELKTSEGTHKLVSCTHTMKQWSENMEAYLRSAMSYCDAFDLNEFKENAKLIVNSISEINSVNK